MNEFPHKPEEEQFDSNKVDEIFQSMKTAHTNRKYMIDFQIVHEKKSKGCRMWNHSSLLVSFEVMSFEESVL